MPSSKGSTTSAKYIGRWFLKFLFYLIIIIIIIITIIIIIIDCGAWLWLSGWISVDHLFPG